MVCGQRERDAERHRPEIIDLHLPGHGYDSPGAIRLAHGFIEQGGNNAAVRVSGRTGKPLGEARVANDRTGIIDEETQPKAGAVLLAAAEAVMQRAMGERG